MSPAHAKRCFERPCVGGVNRAYFSSERGFVMVITVILTVLTAFVAILVLSLGSSQKQLADHVAGKRLVSYYRAQAGVVDAQWRIRQNITRDIDPRAEANFLIDAYDPPEYYVDLTDNKVYRKEDYERNARVREVVDVRVDIGRKDVSEGTRKIEVEGLDTPETSKDEGAERDANPV